MAWELTWPMALIDLGVVILLHGFLEVQGESADSVWAVLAFFGVSPWVVRRGLNLKYGRLRVQPKLSYQQSLKVMWLLAWRPLAPSLVALLAISATLRLARVDTHAFVDSYLRQDPLVNALGLSFVDAITSMVFLPFVIPACCASDIGVFVSRYEEVPVRIKLPKGRQK